MKDALMTCTDITAASPDTARKSLGLLKTRRPPTISPNDALLLDLDGTLLELAETPEGVRCPPDLPDLLRQLTAVLDGAVAIISGRSLECIDDLLKPLLLTGAGIYGAEMRLHPAGPITALDVPEIEALASQLHGQFDTDPRIRVENKRASVAIHFRLAPERAEECRKALTEHAPCPPLKIIGGKCVVEACPAVNDKGSALARIMAVEPFRGRRPVFVGDDRSDEAAFEAAALLGGHGIKVGAGRTAAFYRIRSVRNVWSWLRSGRDQKGEIPL